MHDQHDHVLTMEKFGEPKSPLDLLGPLISDSQNKVPSWLTNTTMENPKIVHGKIHYKW